MDGWTPIDDAFVMSETTNFDLDMTSDYLNNLPLSLLDYANDAETADVLPGIDTNITHYDLSNDYICPVNQSFYNLNDLFTPEHTNIGTSPVDWDWDWDFMMLSTLNESPSSIALNGSNTTTEPSEYTSTYTISSTSTVHSPTGPKPLQVSGNAPEQAIDDKVASSTNTRRRTKMKPGTRPCDLK